MLQYKNSPVLQSLISNLVNAMQINPVTNQPQTYVQFCNDWLNINTCTTAGLNNWGLILNFGRSIEVLDYGGIFGIPNTGEPIPTNNIDYPQNLGGFGNFFNPQAQKASRTNLIDDTYRIALRFQYCKTVSDGSVYFINNMFRLYFGDRFNNGVIAYVAVPSTNFYNYRFIGAYDAVTNPYGYTLQEQLLFGIANNLGLLPTPLGTQQSCSYS